jgi:uncharacterized protein YqeY
MSMLEALRERLTAARKAGETAKMNVLQVVLGDASMVEARTGHKASDEEVEKIIRKVLLGNQETMGHLEQRGQAGAEAHAKLAAESAFLQSLLPQTLSVDAIAAELAAVADALRGAKNDGQATGVAMKHLKGKGLRVLGDDVAAAVRSLRSRP